MRIAQTSTVRSALSIGRGDYRAAEKTLHRAVELDERQSSDYGAADNRLLLAQTYWALGNASGRSD